MDINDINNYIETMCPQIDSELKEYLREFATDYLDVLIGDYQGEMGNYGITAEEELAVCTFAYAIEELRSKLGIKVDRGNK